MKELIFYLIAVVIGTALFYAVYELFLLILSNVSRAATISWIVSYLISIFFQNLLFRYLVFGPIKPYFRSLLYTYLAYSLSIVLSSVFTDLLVYRVGLNERLSWFITFSITGVINYFIISHIFADKKDIESIKCKQKPINRINFKFI